MKTLVRIFVGVATGVVVIIVFRFFNADDFDTGLFAGLFAGLFSNIAQDLTGKIQKG